MMIKKIINSLQFSLENVTVKLCFLTVYIHSLYWWIPPYLYLKHLLILILPLSQYGPFAKSPTNKIHFWTCLIWPKLFSSINNLVSPLILFTAYWCIALLLIAVLTLTPVSVIHHFWALSHPSSCPQFSYMNSWTGRKFQSTAMSQTPLYFMFIVQ